MNHAIGCVQIKLTVVENAENDRAALSSRAWDGLPSCRIVKVFVLQRTCGQRLRISHADVCRCACTTTTPAQNRPSHKAGFALLQAELLVQGSIGTR